MNTRAPYRPRICPLLSVHMHRRRWAAPQRTGAVGHLTPRQRAAVRAVMRLFVEEDLARGVSPRQRLHCSACRRPRPMPGFVRYGEHLLCNECATAYEVARLCGQVRCANEFVRRHTTAGTTG